MSRWRFQARALWTLTLVITLLHASRSQCQDWELHAPREQPNTTCAVYSLADLGEDPSVGLWAADTLLKLMDTGTWKGEGAGRWLLNYHPQSRLLVVHHTPAVQAKVEAFLRDMRKAHSGTTARNGAGTETQVIQAGATAPAVIRQVDGAAPAPPSYIVPKPAQQPRHLLHFIIRYEGEGISDGGLLDDVRGGPGKNAVLAESTGQAVCRSLAELVGASTFVGPESYQPPSMRMSPPSDFASPTTLLPPPRRMPAPKD